MRSSSLNMLTNKSASCKDLFSCIYDLSTSELALLALLLKEKDSVSLDDLAKSMHKDRATVFRSLQKLVSLGLCTKATMNIKEGGYYHVYAAASIELIEKNTALRVREIQKSLDLLMKKFKSDIKQMALT
jgi:predicted transcriptional regulator